MVRSFAKVVALTAIYLLALGQIQPGDILVGVLLAVLLVASARFIHSIPPTESASPMGPALRRIAGLPALIGGTLVDIGRGSWTVARYCLRKPPDAEPGTVTIPIGRSSPSSATTWGIRVGVSPDTVVVDVDERRGEMLLHVLDARDPDAVRADQRDSYERRQRRVFP